MRVVVFGAGGPAGVNTCRALHMAGHDVVCQDDNPEHLVWCEPYGEITTDRDVDADVGWAQPDRLVRWLRGQKQYRTLLPTASELVTCGNKYRTGVLWANYGLRSCPVLVKDEIPDWLHVAADRFGIPYWLRRYEGAGGTAAIKVDDLRTGYHWVRYWHSLGIGGFIAEEYLPGPDYCWTSLWSKGELVAAFTRQRHEWVYSRIGTPSIVEIVHHAAVAATAREAVEAVTEKPHGVFAVDLKEDREGTPRPTEVNAGRWPTTTGLYAELGPNLPDLAVRLANGETVEPLGEDCYPEMMMYRNMDSDLVFTPAHALA